jgi:hypothetical protein
MINVIFLLLILIIAYVIKTKLKLYKDKLDEMDEDKIEGFYGGKSIMDNQYLEKHKNVKRKPIYTYTYDLNKYIFTLHTNFMYSMEYKLGVELSKIIPLKIDPFVEKNIIKNNINKEKAEELLNKSMLQNILEPNNELVLCSESDYHEQLLIENSVARNNYRFVCSFYYMEMILFVRSELDIQSWQELLEYYKKGFENPSRITFGLPLKNSNSYNDAKKLFSTLNINIESDKDEEKSFIKFVSLNDKELFKRFKKPISDDAAVHVIYLTTSYKHPYLNEYLLTNSVNIITMDGLNINSIRKKKGMKNIFEKRIENDKYTNIIKKKNLYADDTQLQGNFKVSVNPKEDDIIGKKFSMGLSTRLIMLANKKIPNNFIKYFLRNIYAHRTKLKRRLQNYLLDNLRLNYLDNLLEARDMFYCHNILNGDEYHDGAYEFYKEVGFIVDEEDYENKMNRDYNNQFGRLIRL